MNNEETNDSINGYNTSLVIAYHLEQYVKHALEITAALESYYNITKTTEIDYPKWIYLSFSAHELLKCLVIEVGAIMDRAYYRDAINCSITALKETLKLDMEKFFLDYDGRKQRIIEIIENIIAEYESCNENIETLRNKTFAHHDLLSLFKTDYSGIDVQRILHEIKGLLFKCLDVFSDLFSCQNSFNYDYYVQDFTESINGIIS